jgi:hypothetical protein
MPRHHLAELVRRHLRIRQVVQNHVQRVILGDLAALVGLLEQLQRQLADGLADRVDAGVHRRHALGDPLVDRSRRRRSCRRSLRFTSHAAGSVTVPPLLYSPVGRSL